jgi:hypothetical protein
MARSVGISTIMIEVTHGHRVRDGPGRVDVRRHLRLDGSYRAAFVNGVLWNLLNLAIAAFLLQRPGRRRPLA